MTQRFLVVAVALAAASLVAAGPALATCVDGHTVAGNESPATVSVQPAPEPVEATAQDPKAETPDVRTAEAKPAAQ